MRAFAYHRAVAATGVAVLCTGLLPASPAAATILHDWSTPLAETTVQTDLVAASGRSILTFAGTTYRLSTDFGATWRTVRPALSGASGVDHPDYVANGVAAFRVWSGRGVVVDLGSGASRDVDLSRVRTDAEAELVALTDTHVLLQDSGRVVLGALDAGLVATATTLPEWADLPAAPSRTRSATDRWAMDAGFAYHLRSYGGSGWVGLATDVDPVDLDGSAGPAAFRVPGDLLFVHLLDSTSLEYAYRTAASVNRCVRDLAASTSSCRKLVPAGRSTRVYAERMGGALVVTVGARVYTCADATACAPGRVRLPGRLSVVSTSHPIGDPAEPLLSLGVSGGGPLYSVRAEHRLVLRSAALTAPAVPGMLGLAADRVVGTDARSSGAGFTAWQRTLTPSGIGPETLLGTEVTDVAASAARVATSGRSGLVLFDDGQKSSRVRRTGTLTSLSGPHPLVLATTSTWIGAPLASLKRVSGAVTDNFGTRLLSLAPDRSALVVTDLADPGYRRDVPLPDDQGENAVPVSAQLLGDWLGVTFLTYRISGEEFDVSLSARVTRIGSAPVWSTPVTGLLADLGDGLAVVCDIESDTYTARAWNLATGELSGLPGAARYSYPAVDSGRIAYATDTDLVVREIAGTGASAPRVLGSVAPAGCNAWACSWSLQVDATKAFVRGQLVIRDAAGHTRALATPAAMDGSLRGVTWDGKLDDGSYAPAGTYTWQLSAAASDGSGALRAIDGNQLPGGTVTVTQHRLGRAKLGSVRISDATPQVGQLLSVAARVRPADATLSYTWYAGATVVASGSGDAGASYQVQPADAGARLRVVVTAQRDGCDPLARGSAWTRAVA